MVAGVKHYAPAREEGSSLDNFVPLSQVKRIAKRRPFPPWLKKRIPAGYSTETLDKLRTLRLNTVCQSARCPNLAECFSRRVATFMILGDICTRRCRYCAVATGRPKAPDPDEPRRVAEAAAWMDLRHVVVTSVNRDDMKDDGSTHWAAVVRAIKRRLTGALVEVLTPDFRGKLECVERVLDAGPDVFNHNIETVPRLFPSIRLGGNYQRSIHVLEHAKAYRPDAPTKSGLMVGFGETRDEVRRLFDHLRAAGVGILTVGQYIQPSPDHAEVAEYVHPDVFEQYREYAVDLGFESVAAGPFVRSSYQAEQVYEAMRA